MAKRSSEKDKKITLTDVKEPTTLKEFFGWRNRYWEKLMRNAQMGELNLPSVEEVNTRLDEYAEECGFVRDYEQNPNPAHINIIDYNNYYPRIGNYDGITGKCSICGTDLTHMFPSDFPDEWKFCCTCKMIAESMVNGNSYNGHWSRRQESRLKKVINLVG